MSIDGSYIMWFTRYGCAEMRSQYSLEDCYELAWMLEDAESCVFDQYGCLNSVERIGVGEIPDGEWEQGFEAFREGKRAVAEKQLEAQPKPYGAVEILPPGKRDRFGTWVHAATVYGALELDEEFFRLKGLFGAERVRTRTYVQQVPA